MALVFRKDKLIDSLRNAYLSQNSGGALLEGINGIPDTRTYLQQREGVFPAPEQTLGKVTATSTLKTQTHGFPELEDTLIPIPAEPETEPETEAETEPETAAKFEPSSIGDLKSLKLQQLELDFEEDSDFDDHLIPIDDQSQRVDPRNSTVPSPTKQPAQKNVFAKKSFKPPSVHSQLSGQLLLGAKNPREQYLEASAGISANPESKLKLKVHFSNNKFIEVEVRKDCTTHLAIGYAILKAGIKPGDANLYNLHLAEDDGQPDDDFPALDRRRPVSSYHVDELAIVRASEREFVENSKQTPNKVPFPKVQQRPTSYNRPAKAALTDSDSAKSVVLSDKLVSVNMYMYPYDPFVSQPFWVKSMVPSDSKLSEIFQHMCWEKMMDTDMYVLRKIENPKQKVGDKDGPGIANMSQTVADFLHIEDNVLELPNNELDLNMEVVARRNLIGFTNPKRSVVETSESQKKKQPKNDLLESAVMSMQPLGFYKYNVVRRQQMNFLGRSERELIIDGEYIHLMPLADWSVVDQPKTTTFHIRQVLRVKQSSKVATNLSIIIMKPTGPKRYDLECESGAVVLEIIARLQRLRRTVGRSLI